MTVAEFIVKVLVDYGVTDIFGIPGGVILDFLYAAEKQGGLTPHLMYHEQSAGFAAAGYAQVNGKLGVAYSTRGPGVSNMITPMADAYFESTPVLFLTAHAEKGDDGENIRIISDQEWNPINSVRDITKYAARINEVGEVSIRLYEAIEMALSGRRGPVFLDFQAGLLNEIMPISDERIHVLQQNVNIEINGAIRRIEIELSASKRPVILIGDGVNQSSTGKMVRIFAESNSIPVIGSRYSIDVMNDSELYYGYIGSHGLRYSNFILSKADCIIALGNRLSFPIQSGSYKAIYSNARIIRVDIDENEFERNVPGSICINCDLRELMSKIVNTRFRYQDASKWILVCDEMKNTLFEYDVNEPARKIACILKKKHKDSIIVSDVGNHEFWLSRAVAYIKNEGRTLYSKSFGVLGCGLGKSIGAYYCTLRPVLCFIGDQGMQLNIQELQCISQNKLPIAIIVLNNTSSGMIRQAEIKKYDHLIHTTEESGYGNPIFEKVAETYGINYYSLDIDMEQWILPAIIEIKIDESIELEPYLPKNKPIQNMSPQIEGDLYEYLDML